MSKTVVLLLSVLVSGISFRTAAATTAACDALLANPVAQALIAQVARATAARVDVAELLRTRAEIMQEQAAYVAQIWDADAGVRLAELDQAIGGRPSRALKDARAVAAAARQREALVRPRVDEVMTENVDAKILAAAVEVDPYFALLRANHDGAHFVVEGANEALNIVAALTAAQPPRGSFNPWPYVRAQLLTKRSAEFATRLEALWPEVFRIAREMKFKTAPPARPTPLAPVDLERLGAALTQLRDEATPTRDLLKARLDEIVRGVLGVLAAPPVEAVRPRRYRLHLRKPSAKTPTADPV